MSWCSYCNAQHPHGKHTRPLHRGHPDFRETTPQPVATQLRCHKCDGLYVVVEGHVCPNTPQEIIERAVGSAPPLPATVTRKIGEGGPFDPNQPIEEVDAELRAMGLDPVVVAERGCAIGEKLKAYVVTDDTTTPIRGTCSFCGSVHVKVVCGPAVYICTDCIALCADIVGYVPAGYVEEASARYTVRIKELDDRAERAIKILRGTE